MSEAPILTVADVVRTFGGGRTLTGRHRPANQAIRGISFTVAPGETLGLVGESGCGKSTLARMIVGLHRPTAGTVTIGADGAAHPARAQYVFQDPVASLNPRKRVRQALDVPLRRLARLGTAERTRRMDELMDLVNLDRAHLERYPHELSGGQAQRIAIARSLAADPQLIVLDEPVSALDVSVQAQVLHLLAELKARLGLTYLFISHDLSVVEAVSDRVAILYFGKLVELGSTRDVYNRPQHPYTDLLLASAPAPGRPLAVSDDAQSELPDPYAPPPGCAFAARCPRAQDVCRQTEPELVRHGRAANQISACHFPLNTGPN